MKHRSLLLLVAIVSTALVSAQDPQLSQFYAAPQYLNPALTGDTYQHRAVLNYRMQWPGSGPGYRTTMASYDHSFAKLNAGIGGYVLHDIAGSGGLSHTDVAFGYAYEARINYKRSVRAGMRVGYSSRGIGTSGFVFTDQLIRDQAAVSVENNVVERIGFLDLAAGGLYRTACFWAGVSVDHLTTPNMSLMAGAEARMPMRFSVQTGHRFALDGSPLEKSSTSLTTAVHAKKQGTWDQVDIGAYIDHHGFITGLWYRGLPVQPTFPGHANNESLTVLAGYEIDGGLRIAYSYDLSLARFRMHSGGAHEISLVHEWWGTSKPKHRPIPCPKF